MYVWGHFSLFLCFFVFFFLWKRKVHNLTNWISLKWKLAFEERKIRIWKCLLCMISCFCVFFLRIFHDWNADWRTIRIRNIDYLSKIFYNNRKWGLQYFERNDLSNEYFTKRALWRIFWVTALVWCHNNFVIDFEFWPLLGLWLSTFDWHLILIFLSYKSKF